MPTASRRADVIMIVLGRKAAIADNRLLSAVSKLASEVHDVSAETSGHAAPSMFGVACPCGLPLEGRGDMEWPRG
jgi:hypothetical protein